jgi:hypothetical protein
MKRVIRSLMGGTAALDPDDAAAFRRDLGNDLLVLASQAPHPMFMLVPAMTSGHRIRA